MRDIQSYFVLRKLIKSFEYCYHTTYPLDDKF